MNVIHTYERNNKVPLYLAVNKCESETQGIAQAQVNTPFLLLSLHAVPYLACLTSPILYPASYPKPQHILSSLRVSCCMLYCSILFYPLLFCSVLFCPALIYPLSMCMCVLFHAILISSFLICVWLYRSSGHLDWVSRTLYPASTVPVSEIC